MAQFRNAMMGYAQSDPSTADLLNVPLNKGSVLPFTEYLNRTDFDPSAGILGSIGRAVTAPARAYRGEISDAQMLDEGNNFAGWMTLGGYMSPKPMNALGAGGAKLDMSEAARLARAQEMGFDTEIPWYHGTFAKFDNFELGKEGASSGVGRPGLSDSYVTFTDDINHAKEYGDVGKYFVRGKRKVYDAVPDIEYYAKEYGFDNAQDYIDDFGSFYAATGLDDLLYEQSLKAMKEGYDILQVKFGDLTGAGFSKEIGGDVLAVFDPRNIRAIDAAFDPGKSHMSDLLASNGRNSIMPGGLFLDTLRQDEGPIY